MLQTCACIFSVFLWPFLSWSAICGGIPHFVALVSTYLSIFVSAAPKFLISLQASSGLALRSLAALISLPRFSASSRKGRKPFMQASAPPDAACGGGPPIPPPANGAAPLLNGEAPPTDAAGAAPLTGGNGDALLAGAA